MPWRASPSHTSSAIAHRQPARIGDRLGPPDRTTAWSGDRLAMSPHRRFLRRRCVSAALAPWLAERTGLAIDPLFSASKMRWLLDHIPDGTRRAERGELCLGTMDSWVLWNLTGGTDHASRPDQRIAHPTARHSPAHLERRTAGAVRRAACCACRTLDRRAAPFGTSASRSVGLPAGIPIMSVIGDSHAALFGQAGFRPGSVKATYGTGSSLMTPTAAPVLSQHGLSTTIAWALDHDAVLPMPWKAISPSPARRCIGSASFWACRIRPRMSRRWRRRVEDSGGLYLVPAFVGLGAPYWNDAARGLISGLTRGAACPTPGACDDRVDRLSGARCVRRDAALKPGTDLKVLLADGGASRNTLLMQFQADIIGLPVLRSTSVGCLRAGCRVPRRACLRHLGIAG